MQQIEKLIINTEFFLQCYGSCSGCFLTIEERKSNSIYSDNIINGLLEISKLYKNIKIKELIIAFGRGNILNLNNEDLDLLLKITKYVETIFSYDKVIFEVSTSLIGKLDKQTESSEYLLNNNNNIFFNMVINSEITSPTFWKNLDFFYNHNANIRKSWGWKEDWGDILVLNVNPKKLPDLDFLYKFTKDYPSPINISIFPFDENEKTVNDDDLNSVMNWSEKLWLMFHNKDLNIKNYLNSLAQYDVENSIKDINNYQYITENSYYFIDKNGIIANGSLSIMGEVDKLRLLSKYDLSLNIINAYRNMQRNKACANCDYQKECLLSGAYLNFMANNSKYNENNEDICLSGYKKLFQLSKV